MNILNKSVAVALFVSSLSLNGCVTPIHVTKGMTLEEVNTASVRSIKGNLVSLGRIEELPMYELYETDEQNFARTFEDKYGRKSYIFTLEPENSQFFLFYQGQLQMAMSGPELSQFIKDKKLNEQKMIAAANRAAQKKRDREIQERNKKIEDQKKAAEEARMQRIMAAEEDKRKRIEKNTKPILSTE